MAQAAKLATQTLNARSPWPESTELVGLSFVVVPTRTDELFPQYTVGLHAWFLDQMRQLDPDLSAYLHDGESEKPFSLTGLSGQFASQGESLRLEEGKSYTWRVNGLSQRVAQGLARWLKVLPGAIALKNAPLPIQSVRLASPPTTYAQLLKQTRQGSVSLTFVSPTSFRRKGHHLPLPWPTNVFHSYLRRWNHFAPEPVDQDDFLDWIDDFVIVQQHRIASAKVAAGKRGSVTGFTGTVTYGLDKEAAVDPEFQRLFYALVNYAPFCGTGHKTTFGLGETQVGRAVDELLGAGERGSEGVRERSGRGSLGERIGVLTELFISQRKRQGGQRAKETAKTWATILARRERGDSLRAIAADLKLPYETAKTYSKLARRAAAPSPR